MFGHLVVSTPRRRMQHYCLVGFSKYAQTSLSGFIRSASMQTNYHMSPLRSSVSAAQFTVALPATCCIASTARTLAPRHVFNLVSMAHIPITTCEMLKRNRAQYTHLPWHGPCTGSRPCFFFHSSTRPHHNSQFFSTPAGVLCYRPEHPVVWTCCYFHTLNSLSL